MTSSASTRGRIARHSRRGSARSLQLIAEGHSTKEIARRLQLSVKTIETHRAQIMLRLDIHHVAGLVQYAIRRKIV